LRYYVSDPKAKNLLVYWELGTKSKQFAIPEKNAEDPVDVVIDDLEAGDIYFELFTLNEKMQNKSIPYSVDGIVYGDGSQQTWRNRPLIRIALVFENNEILLKIEWDKARNTETGIKLDYTDNNGVSRSIMVANAETATTIRDIKTGEPLFCTTQHKVAPSTSNTYFAPKVELKYDTKLNLTAMLKNTSMPFARGNHVLASRWYEVLDWKTNPAGSANGNVDIHQVFFYGLLSLPANGAVGQPGSMINGKLWQTVELDAGTYSFDVVAHHNLNTTTYIVVALGDDLPDIDNVTTQSLRYTYIPITSQTDILLVTEFVLTEKSTVSLGFVTTITNGQCLFKQVELWRK